MGGGAFICVISTITTITVVVVVVVAVVVMAFFGPGGSGWRPPPQPPLQARPKHGGQHGQSRDNRVERRAGKIAWQEQRIEELEQEAARLNSAQELRAECDGEIAKRKAAEEEVVQAVQAKHRCRGRDGQDEKRTMLQICGVQM